MLPPIRYMPWSDTLGGVGTSGIDGELYQVIIDETIRDVRHLDTWFVLQQVKNGSPFSQRGTTVDRASLKPSAVGCAWGRLVSFPTPDGTSAVSPANAKLLQNIMG